MISEHRLAIEEKNFLKLAAIVAPTLGVVTTLIVTLAIAAVTLNLNGRVSAWGLISAGLLTMILSTIVFFFIALKVRPRVVQIQTTEPATETLKTIQEWAANWGFELDGQTPELIILQEPHGRTLNRVGSLFGVENKRSGYQASVLELGIDYTKENCVYVFGKALTIKKLSTYLETERALAKI
jgi:hypothetical protein